MKKLTLTAVQRKRLKMLSSIPNRTMKQHKDYFNLQHIELYGIERNPLVYPEQEPSK